MTSSTDSTPRLLILGASTRAAAWSAYRAGFQPVCADLFLDADLRSIAEIRPVSKYPDGFPIAVAELPPTPWIYTGGLENYPEIVAEISMRHPLWGNPPAVLKTVRDPWWLWGTCQRQNIRSPEIVASTLPPPADGKWLLKPLRGSGGKGIVRWTDEIKNSPFWESPHLFQRYQPGLTCSALFLANHSTARLCAVFEQLPRSFQLAAPSEFGYPGSLYPIMPLSDSVQKELARIGNVIAEEAGLRGIFGIDLILVQNSVWLLEVNPRYTASVELWEHASQRSLLREHCQAFGGNEFPTPPLPTKRQAPSQVLAKQILYAPGDFQMPSVSRDSWLVSNPWELPSRADIPQPGSLIRAGEPICTLLVSAPTRSAAFEQLSQAESGLALELGLFD